MTKGTPSSTATQPQVGRMTAVGIDSPPPKLNLDEAIKVAKSEGRPAWDPRDLKNLEVANTAPRAKVRFSRPEGQRSDQVREGVEWQNNKPVQSENVLNKSEAVTLAKDSGADVKMFEEMLENGQLFGTRKESGRWEIPEASARTGIAIAGGDPEYGLTESDENRADGGDFGVLGSDGTTGDQGDGKGNGE